jgi:hypothetical protein
MCLYKIGRIKFKERLLPYAAADFTDKCDNKYEGNV